MILEIYRGYTITDEPNGACPYSIYNEDQSQILDTDSENLRQVRQTIDIIADEQEAKELAENEEAVRSRYSSDYAMWKDLHPGYY